MCSEAVRSGNSFDILRVEWRVAAIIGNTGSIVEHVIGLGNFEVRVLYQSVLGLFCVYRKMAGVSGNKITGLSSAESDFVVVGVEFIRKLLGGLKEFIARIVAVNTQVLNVISLVTSDMIIVVVVFEPFGHGSSLEILLRFNF